MKIIEVSLIIVIVAIFIGIAYMAIMSNQPNAVPPPAVTVTQPFVVSPPRTFNPIYTQSSPVSNTGLSQRQVNKMKRRNF